MGGKVPPPSGSPPGSHAYPSLRPSMGSGTRPPRSKAEVMLSSWSSAGSQRPPKAVRKRLAGVEGSTSSTSWLRTRNSAWYGSRGPGGARLAPQAAPSPADPPQASPPKLLPRSLQTSSFLLRTPYITGSKRPSPTPQTGGQQSRQGYNPRGFPGRPAPHFSPSLSFHIPPPRRDPPRLVLGGGGRAG